MCLGVVCSVTVVCLCGWNLSILYYSLCGSLYDEISVVVVVADAVYKVFIPAGVSKIAFILHCVLSMRVLFKRLRYFCLSVRVCSCSVSAFESTHSVCVSVHK